MAKTVSRFPSITTAAFNRIAERADEVRERDYRGLSGGELIRMAMVGGKVMAMSYSSTGCVSCPPARAFGPYA